MKRRLCRVSGPGDLLEEPWCLWSRYWNSSKEGKRFSVEGGGGVGGMCERSSVRREGSPGV